MATAAAEWRWWRQREGRRRRRRLRGVISGIFGKSSSSITDAGLSISGTAAQMQQGQGVNQYADKTTTKKSWFSKSVSTSTILQDAGADVSRQFGLIFGGVSDSLQSAAGAMGQDAAAVAQRLASYVIDIPRLSLQGLELIELRILSDIAKGRPPGPQTSLIKMLASSYRQDVDLLAVDLYGEAGLQLETARPFYGHNAPEPVHSRDAQLATPRYLNSRAWTIFGGTNEVQASIIAKTVLGL